MKIFDRHHIEKNYESILAEAGISQSDFSRSDLPYNLQSSSGSGSGRALLIPRTASDLADIYSRMLSSYLKLGMPKPKSIAMLGGISHLEAQKALNFGGVVIHSFNDISAFVERKLSPEILTCYPNLLRDLMANQPGIVKGVSAIKVGGEVLFRSDIKKLFAINPDVVLIEQFGSTELPALASRVLTKKSFASMAASPFVKHPFHLHTERFDFHWDVKENWAPVIAQDNFAQLLFRIGGFYDSGDEALFESGEVVAFRRVNGPAQEFLECANALLEDGATQVQFDLHAGKVVVEGGRGFAPTVRCGLNVFKTENNTVTRLSSNKVKLVT